MRQLSAFGVERWWVRRRVAKGWLRPMYRGAYLVGPLESPLSRPMASVLAAGDGALLSHYPAAVLWGFRPPCDGPPHVTIVGRDVRRNGIRVHRVAHLHPADATRHLGIPVTSPARTLLDLAATATASDLARAIEEAQIQQRVSTHSLNEQFSRYPRHQGTAALREAIRTDPKLTRSEVERLALDVVRRARLPEPQANVRLGGWEVDLLWRAERVVVEVDGYAFHSSRSSFERDRRRDADLVARGWRVLRVTWRQLTAEPEAFVAALAAALAA